MAESSEVRPGLVEFRTCGPGSKRGELVFRLSSFLLYWIPAVIFLISIFNGLAPKSEFF